MFANSAVVKYHTLGGFDKIYFLKTLDAQSQKPRCRQSWLPLRPLSLAFAEATPLLALSPQSASSRPEIWLGMLWQLF